MKIFFGLPKYQADISWLLDGLRVIIKLASRWFPLNQLIALHKE